jgi:hypothetical protein
LVMDQNEMSTLDRGPPIDASYQVSVHLAMRFQKRIIFKISQSETSVDYGGHLVNGSRRNEQSIEDLP